MMSTTRNKRYRPLKILIFTIFILWLSSCGINNNRTKDEPIINKEYYPNGALMREEIILNDSNKTRIVKKYYEDGVLKDSIPYIGDKINGTRKYFDRKEELIYFAEFENGQKNGADIAYYLSGKLSYYGQSYNDKQIGEWIFYYPDGKVLTYEYFASTGERMYIRKYDTTGALVTSSGVGLIEMRVKADSVEVNQPFEARIILATPPESQTYLKMVKEVDGLPLPVYKINDNEYRISYSFTTPGEYRINSTWQIENRNSEKNEKGEQWFVIKVR